MIVNVIMFKLKEKNDENIKILQAKLLEMKGNIEQLKDITVKPNMRGDGFSSFEVIMIAKYDSIQAMTEYLINPLHANVGKYVMDMCEQIASVCYEEI